MNSIPREDFFLGQEVSFNPIFTVIPQKKGHVLVNTGVPA